MGVCRKVKKFEKAATCSPSTQHKLHGDCHKNYVCLVYKLLHVKSTAVVLRYGSFCIFSFGFYNNDRWFAMLR